MKDLAIYGSNGFGEDLYCLIQRFLKKNDWNFLGFFDDTKLKGSNTHYGKILGGMVDLNAWPTSIDIVLAIGYPRGRRGVYNEIQNPNVSFPNIIAGDLICYDFDSFSLGKGNIICPSSFIGSHVTLGNFNVINGSSLGHDVCMGDFNTMMPGVHISGKVRMGDANLFGLCSVTIEYLSIGSNNTICPQSVIYRKINDDGMYLGNPAKKV